MKSRMTLAEATAMMDRQRSSGLNVSAFCARENINPGTWYYWRQRLLRQETTEPTMLVPVRIEKSGIGSGKCKQALELAYPNGVRLSIPCDSELSLIGELIQLV